MSSHGTLTKLFALVQQQAGLSRRKAQELIVAGEVSVDEQIVQDPFAPVHVDAVRLLRVRGHPLSMDAPERRVYRYHKPVGMLCSHDDPHEGNTVGRVLRSEGFIGYAWAGRLDQDAEGLLLVTNDGELLNGLTHPRYEVIKTYHVWLRKTPSAIVLRRMLEEMRGGIASEGDLLRIQRGTITGTPPHPTVDLSEGKKREVKRLFSHFGLEVARLQRTALGSVQLGHLRPGALDRLSDIEVAALWRTTLGDRPRLDSCTH